MATFLLSKHAEITFLPGGEVEVKDDSLTHGAMAIVARLAAEATEASDRLRENGLPDEAARHELRRQAFAEAVAAIRDGVRA